MEDFSSENVMSDLKYFVGIFCFDYVFGNISKLFGSNTWYLILIKLAFS